MTDRRPRESGRGLSLRERWRRLGIAAARVVPVAMVIFVALEWHGIPGQDRDTVAYHRAASAAKADGDIYEPTPPPGPHEFQGEWHYLYPPPLAALLALLPAMDYRTFDLVWLLLNFLWFWIFAASLGRISRGGWSWEGATRWGAALFFMPGTLLAIHYGNIEIAILAMAALAMAVPVTAGLTLGLGAAFKVTPIWPLLVLAIRRPGLTLPGVVAALVVSGAACLVVLGGADTAARVAQWLRQILPALGQGQFWGESFARFQQGGLRPIHYLSNLSISFLPVQAAVLWGWWGYEGGPLPGPVRAYLSGVAIGAPLLAAWLTRRRSANVQAAVALAVAVFAAPIVRPYVLPVLLLVLAAFREERRQTDRPRERGVPAPLL